MFLAKKENISTQNGFFFRTTYIFVINTTIMNSIISNHFWGYALYLSLGGKTAKALNASNT